jgi:hypothetical protein
MTRTQLIPALCIVIAASPALATISQPGRGAQAPAGTPQSEYCMHVEPITGSLVQTVQCWTREEWAEQGVDVDKEWAKNGVSVIG